MIKARIYIVEDEALIAMEIRDRLEKLGYEVCGTSARGEDAIAEINKNTPDLVLMDIMLAGELDGIRTAEVLASTFNVPVVYLTAYATEEVLRRAAVSGPYGYILKPFEETDLRIAVELALHRHKIDRKLQESELRHRLFFELASDSIYILAAEGLDAGRIVDANNAAADMHGYSREELLTMKISDLAASEAAPRTPELMGRLLRGEIVKAEVSHRKKDGSIFPIEISAGLLEIGGCKYVLAFDRDISKRKQAEAALRQRYDTEAVINELLSVSVGSADLASILDRALALVLAIPWLAVESRGSIFLAEKDGRELVMAAQKNMPAHTMKACARVSAGVCLCGRAAEAKELLFSDRVDERHDTLPDAGPAHGHYCAPIRRGDKLLGVINIYLREGHRREEHEERFIMAVSHALAGIIERKNIEEERQALIRELQDAVQKISRSDQEWQETFDSITDLVSIHDADFRVIKANKAFREKCGLELGTVEDKPCYELFHGTCTPIMNCPHRMTLGNKEAAHQEVLDPGSKRLFRVSTFPYHSPEGAFIGSVHIARDITEERDKELRLIMSERLASLGQMASGLAHEINNPLAGIAGCAEGLKMKVQGDRFEPAQFVEYLDIIEEEVMRCKSITTGMLSFVRKSSYEQKEVDLNKLLDKGLEIIGFQGRLQSMAIEKRYAPALPVLQGNEGELRQVFIVLISNALDAMEEKGTLTVETGVEGDRVYAKVGDTGPGITPEHLTRIFDPFFTTKSDKGGSGLGLSIAHRIVANHGGDIEVVSDAGKGAVFAVTLPVSQQG